MNATYSQNAALAVDWLQLVLAAALMADADAHVTAAIELLQQGAALPVAFAGGLGPVFQARLTGRWTIVAPLASPLEGAVQLARAMADA